MTDDRLAALAALWQRRVSQSARRPVARAIAHWQPRGSPSRTSTRAARGEQWDAVSGLVGHAREVFDALASVGVDLTDVFVVLENEGIEKFEKSWTELLETVRAN